MLICLYCLEYNIEKDDLIQNSRCTHCGNRLVYGDKEFKSVIDYRGSKRQLAEKFLQNCYEVHEGLEEKVRETIKGAESGIEASVADEITTYFYLNYDDQSSFGIDDWESQKQKKSVLFGATALGYFQSNYKMDAAVKIANRETEYDISENYSFHDLFSKIATIAQYPKYSSSSTPEGSQAGGYYSYEDKHILLKTIPQELVEEIKTDLSYKKEGLPHLLQPFIDHISISSSEELQITVNHEMTHAYIDKKTDTGEKTYLRAIDEAAAMVTGYVRRGDWGGGYPDAMAYRNNREPKALLQTLIKCFIEICNEKNTSPQEKITFIRETAVEAIEKLQNSQKTIHPIEAVISETNTELRTFYNVLRRLETAEYYSFHAMQLIGVIKREIDMKDWVHDSIEQQSPYKFRGYDSVLDSHSGPRREQDEPVMEKLVPEMEELEKKLEQIIKKKGNPEEKEELKQIKSDLSNFMELFTNERRYFNKFESREATEFEEKLSDSAMNSRVGEIIYEEKLQEAEKEIENRLNSYRDIIQHTIKLNEKILTVLKEVHEQESILHKQEQLQIVDQLAEDTEQAYKIFQKTEQDLKKSTKLLEEAEEKLHN